MQQRPKLRYPIIQKQYTILFDAGVQIDDDVDGRHEDFCGDEDDDCADQRMIES